MSISTTTQTIGIVICTKNRSLSLYRLINSLVKYHNQPNSYTIIDDISDHQSVSPKKISQIIGKTKLYYISVKFNDISQSRNLSLKVCPETIMVSFDDDTEIKSNIVARIKYNFLHHPQICAFTPTILSTDQTSLSIVSTYWMNRRYYHTTGYTPKIESCAACFAINLKAVKDYHIHFPDDIHHTYEDILFFLHLHRHHLIHWHDPKMVVYHHYNLRHPLQTYFRFFQYGENVYSLIQNYPRFFRKQMNWYFPHRLLDYLFLPIFTIKTTLKITILFVQDTLIPRQYYLQVFLTQFCYLLGAYSHFPYLKKLTNRFLKKIKLTFS